MYAAVLLIVMLVFRGGAVRVVAALVHRFRPERTPSGATPAASDVDLSSLLGGGQAIDEVTMDGVDVVFGGVHALADVPLTIRRGEVVGLIGPNGAGKTTAVNAMTGVVRPARGDVRLGGQSIRGRRPYRVARAGIGRTYQHPQLPPG